MSLDSSVNFSNRNAPKASPVQGEVAKIYLIFDGGVVFKNQNFLSDNPSVKIGSEKPILTAPFTQGSLMDASASLHAARKELLP